MFPHKIKEGAVSLIVKISNLMIVNAEHRLVSTNWLGFCRARVFPSSNLAGLTA